MARGVYDAASLPATLTIAVGAASVAGTGSIDGGIGGTASATGGGFTLQAFGGGGGASGNVTVRGPWG